MSRACTAWLNSTPPSSVAFLPAPFDRVVVGPPPPRDLDRRGVRPPGDARVDERLHLLQPVAEPVLEHRHEPTRGGRSRPRSADRRRRATRRPASRTRRACRRRARRGTGRGAATAACRCARSRCRPAAASRRTSRRRRRCARPPAWRVSSSGSHTATMAKRSRNRRSARTCSVPMPSPTTPTLRIDAVRRRQLTSGLPFRGREHDSLGAGLVEVVERPAARDESVARRGGAVRERTAQAGASRADARRARRRGGPDSSAPAARRRRTATPLSRTSADATCGIHSCRYESPLATTVTSGRASASTRAASTSRPTATSGSSGGW